MPHTEREFHVNFLIRGGRLLMASLVWLVVNKISPLELSLESLENLDQLKKNLEKGKSAVLYFNHYSYSDPIIAFTLLRHLGCSVSLVSGPAAVKYMDEKREDVEIKGIKINKLTAPLLKYLRVIGVYAIPVVNVDDIQSYSANEREHWLQEYINHTRLALSIPGGILAVFPEGRRNPMGVKGALQQSKAGIGALDHQEDSIVYVPVGLVPKQYNTNNKTSINVGRPFELSDITGYQVMSPQERADHLMTILAKELLPEEMRGVYSSFSRQH